ncbi:MAG: helix-turn-helix domain-containing protein, partial [Candidatus Bathyarchaeia archaeon]
MSRIRRGFSNQVFQVLSSPIRFEVLRLLRLNRTLTYSEIMDMLGLEPAKHAGKFAYHLRSLVKARLIEKTDDGKTYRLTDLGVRVLEFAQELNEYLMKKAGKLLVRSSRMAIEEFDRLRIVNSLIKEAQVPLDLAESISLEVERRLVNLQVKYLTAPLIREIVNAILIEKGLEEYRHRLTRLGLPVYDVVKTFEKASTMK